MSFDTEALSDAFETTGWEPTAGEWETADWNLEKELTDEIVDAMIPKLDYERIAGIPPEISDYKEEW